MKFSLFAVISLLFSSQLMASPEQIFLLRHSEKASGSDPSLTDKGKLRANNIAKQLLSAKPTQLFSTNYNRTQQTITPLARATSLKVQSYNPRELVQFAGELKLLNGVAVVVGHSNTTPQLVKLLSGHRVNIEEDEYDKLYELRLHGDKYQLIRHKTSAKAR
ncbi:SixA phosphatase family protein [Pseudoalteromonas sp. MTN2-4]|uniref:SixA phosphatase family protein n=1 Tax=Pseudoalteromonas sp. MTN2-4 TaxID=3056555 RepID=UPI0036F302EB